jgi:hypothetical protein
VTRTGWERKCRPEEKKQFGRRVDGRIILKWILRKQNLRPWTVLIWLRIGNGGGLL